MMMNSEEELMPSVEEEEKEEAETEEEEEDDDDDEEEDDEEGGEKSCDSDEEEGEGDVKKEVEATLQATAEKISLPVDATEKKQQANVLNLNNEVVKMRKEVKRVRALIIRKQTRQIAALKKKKGNETEVERNQRRAARLLEEVHSMKNLSPDLVTKTALQKNLNFDQVCRNPKSIISDRAVARIATHPQFSKKIESIKAAVKAFKEERMKSGKQEGKPTAQMHTEKATLPSQDRRGKRENEKKEEDEAVELQEIADTEEGVDVLKDTEDAAGAEKETEKDAHSAGVADIHRNEVPDSAGVRPTSVKSSDEKVIVKTKPQSKAAEKKTKPPPAPVALQKIAEVDESDVESSDNEEKEYFDDSTEERFNKQSSQSEESDDDDFFVGKVSKFKKKKKKQQGIEGERKDTGQEVKKDSTDGVKSSDKLQRELDELESRLKSKATALQSVFCSSLTKAGGGRGRGRGRGDGKFMGQGKPKSLNRDFSKQSKFQNQERGASNSGSEYSKPCPEGRRPESDGKVSASAGRGRGRGRGDVRRQRDLRGGGVFSHPTPQPALHPSWEASKKRKEQQGQILAFQGKKIKFDDDD